MRRWQLWAGWLLALLVAPAGRVLVDVAYPTIPPYPPPWPAEPSAPERLAGGLLVVHLAASAAAAVALPALTRDWFLRLAGWAGIVVWLGLVWLLGLGIMLDKTGKYF
jgi:hypothetical protein